MNCIVDKSSLVHMTITSQSTESAVGSTVLNHSADAVWAVIRDFNSYPAYIDGVTESHLEDDKRGDEVGCVRRFVYNGNTIRQTLTGHSDTELWFTHAGCDPLDWPVAGENVGSVDYTNLVQVRRVTDGDRAFLEWSLEFKSTNPSDLIQWKHYFENSIPVWIASLRAYLDIRAGVPPENTANNGVRAWLRLGNAANSSGCNPRAGNR